MKRLLAVALLAGCSGVASPTLLPTATAHANPSSAARSRWVPESQLYQGYPVFTPPIVLTFDYAISRITIQSDLTYAPVNVWFADHESGPPVQVDAQTIRTLEFKSTDAITIQQALVQEDSGPGILVSQ